jgi:hypothetical protein
MSHILVRVPVSNQTILFIRVALLTAFQAVRAQERTIVDDRGDEEDGEAN